MNIKAIPNMFKSTRILESLVLYLEPRGRNGHCRVAGTSILFWLWRNLIARQRNLDARVPAVLQQENDRWVQGTRKFSLGELKEEETGMEAAAGGSRT